MCSHKFALVAALLGVFLSAPLACFASQPGVKTSQGVSTASPAVEHSGHASYGIDGFAPGDEVSRETRHRLESFKRVVDGDGITYSRSAVSMSHHYLIEMKANASRSSSDQSPKLNRIERVVITWADTTPNVLMDDAKQRHGGTPKCQANAVSSHLNKSSGLGLLLKSLSHARVIDLPDGWSGDQSAPVSGELCTWGDAVVQKDSRVACEGKCLAVSVSRPIQGASLTRMTEISLEPTNDAGGGEQDQAVLLQALGR